MEIQIHSVHFKADSKLEEYITQRLNKLTKFYDRLQSAEVHLKLEGGNSAVKEKVVEIKLYMPGPTIFAKESASKFEPATDQAIDHLRRQLKKYKEKLQSH